MLKTDHLFFFFHTGPFLSFRQVAGKPSNLPPQPMPTSSLPVPLPIPPTEGFWDSLSVYIVAFGDYLDKQW